MTDYSSFDNDIGTLQPAKATIQYHVDISDNEKLNKLEGDIDFLRSMLIDMYEKCPKMKRDFSGNKKKVNKGDDVECENCGGLLW